MSIKINALELENVKRIKAVTLEPSADGLTVIGGKNNQGKTSVLDAIAWALGGNKFRPTSATREGSLVPPHLKITLSNGIVVERKGKNSELKVVDPSGNLAGQALLDSFISSFALDLPKFLSATPKEKAEILLQIIGVGDELFKLEHNETLTYNERTAIGRIADQKAKYAEGLVHHDDAPEEPVSAAELIRSQQEILARNGQRQQWARDYDALLAQVSSKTEALDAARARVRELEKDLAETERKCREAQHSPAELEMESTEELERQISEVEEINRKVRDNLSKAAAQDEAQRFRDQYDELTRLIEKIRAEKMALLNGANLPLPGLSVSDGELTYNGRKWDSLSGSEQLRVATAIVRKFNPECGFVLLDKLEQMDRDTLRDFGTWLENEGLQAIATRVSTGDECSVIIEDGYAQSAAPEEQEPTPEPPKYEWRVKK